MRSMFQTLMEFKRRALKPLGIDVIRYRPTTTRALLLAESPAPVFFDVGANEGQTIELVLKHNPASEIYSFEPSPSTFAKLEKKFGSRPRIHLHNLGLGDRSGTLPLVENTHSAMSSFLSPKDAWGEVRCTTDVAVTTIDEFCAGKDIKKIDVLKVDTQGFEYPVFVGAQRMLDENRVDVIYTEYTFDSMYEGIERFDHLFGFVADRGYRLYGFFDQHTRNGALSWADLIFIRKGLNPDRAWRR